MSHPLNKTNQERKMNMSVFWSTNMNYFSSFTNTPLAEGLAWEAYFARLLFFTQLVNNRARYSMTTGMQP